MTNYEINIFKSGTQNLLDEEIIAKDAASSSYNWTTIDGKLVLAYGRLLVGTEGLTGKVYGEHFGYKVDGTRVHYRKVNGSIQYLNGSTWTDIITGLTATADYSFSNYSSLAGTFTYITGIDGIYKIHNAFPASYMSMYSTSKNYKGYSLIDKGTMFMWQVKNDNTIDKTGLYRSKIDKQNSTVYTTVTGEVIGAPGSTTYTGTLAFKGSTLRNCFGVVITGTVATGTETFTDNYLGVLTGSRGGTGTINYLTGAYSVTFSAVTITSNITASYRWEDSNTNGITDFTYSSTRVAGEGIVLPQDEGGDAIQTVQIGQDGAYYSVKSQSAYRFEMDDTDTNATNLVYRRDIGVTTLRDAVSTGKGIVFINTANQAKPELTLLQRNPLGDNIEPVNLFTHFKFADYTFDDATVSTWDRFILIACKTSTATNNDTVLLCDMTTGTVDITAYNARTFAKDGSNLYIGSSVTQSVYQLYNGFDDDGLAIDNYWIGKGETYNSEKLKKVRKLRIKGRISPNQNFSVYENYDGSGFQLVGTVRGDGTYVDYLAADAVGSNMVGSTAVGGEGSTVYPYYCELKITSPKFRKRQIKIVANEIGYVDIESIMDVDILPFEDRMPSRYRSKQRVNLSGTETDQ